MRIETGRLLFNTRALGALVLLMSLIFVMPNALQAQDTEDNRRSAVHAMTFTQLQDKFYKTEIKKEISVDVHELTVEQALREIARETGLRLSYRGDIMVDKIISLQDETITVSNALANVLDNTGLDYKISQDGYLLITEREDFLDESLQEKVTGTVFDAQTGEALPGVNILIEGTTEGTSTDADGNFELEVSDLEQTLVVTYVGYERLETPINGRTQLTIELNPLVVAGDELVVVGYGTQRKVDITSAVSEVDMENVSDRPVSNLTNLLQGQAPGLVAKQTSGTPGEELQVNIRGISSLGAGSAPLFVVDGFPVGTSVGNNIDPSNIESISVLKDASSTAIYGARGSNGVVLITTKTAKQGDMDVSFNVTAGVQNLPHSRRTEMMNGVEFARFKKEAFMDKIRYFENREPSIDEVPENYRHPEDTQYSTNWLNQILNQNAPFQKYNISVGSGRSSIRSFLSVNYLNEKGAIIETGFERFNVRANLTGDLHEKITMGWNLVGSYSREKYAPTTGRSAIIGSALWADPREPVYNEDGTYNALVGGLGGVFGTPNPVMELREMDRDRNAGNLTTNGYIEFSILENLELRSSVSASIENQSQKEFRPSYLAGRGFNNPPPREAFLNEWDTEVYNYATDHLLTYMTNVAGHNITLTGGFSAQEEVVQNISASGDEFPNDVVRFLDAATRVDANSSETSWSLLAYFTRLNYNFNDRYLVSATFRREGSSRFGSNNRWGNFPAVSLGWRVSEESFIPETDWLSDLKLRGSWGVTGNNSIGNYPSLSTLNSANYIMDGEFVNGQILSSFANRSLGWEQSNQINIGMDLSLFDNRINVTAEAYKKTTQDMLLPVEIPVISGFERTFTNVGEVENKGLEFALGYRKSVREFSYSADFNISFNRNKVIAINETNDELRFGSFYGAYNVSKVGRPIGMLHGYKWLGIFNTEEEIDNHPTQDGAIPGTFKYADTNGDGVVSYDTEDMVEIGNPHPKFVWGLNLGADYKNIDLSVLITGSQDYDIMAQIEKTTLNMDGVFNILAAGKDRWRSSDNIGNGRIPTSNTWKWQRESNSKYVYDASHAWVKNVTIGYSFSNISSISNVRIFASADNLFLISNYPGNNPEVDQFGGIRPGVDDQTYPVPRTFSLGATVNF